MITPSVEMKQNLRDLAFKKAEISKSEIFRRVKELSHHQA